MAANTPVKTLKIAVLGSGSVGKSALTLRYIQNQFVAEYDPTIEDMYTKNVTIDNIQYSIQLLDTAGQEDYEALRSTWMREKDGFIFVFSICDRNSFTQLQTFYNQLLSLYETTQPPLIVVGNKSDLSQQRQIHVKDAEQLAQQYNNSTYIETSAKTGNNIDQTFESLIRSIRRQELLKSPVKQVVTAEPQASCCTIC